MLIGGVSIHLNLEKKEGEMGWILNPDFHKQGIASEAAKLLMQHVIKTYNLKKIIAKCDSRNVASEGVMKKLGMQKIKCEYKTRIDKKTGLYVYDTLIYQIEI